jgi:hypothetical protein
VLVGKAGLFCCCYLEGIDHKEASLPEFPVESTANDGNKPPYAQCKYINEDFNTKHKFIFQANIVFLWMISCD